VLQHHLVELAQVLHAADRVLQYGCVCEGLDRCGELAQVLHAADRVLQYGCVCEGLDRCGTNSPFE